MGGGIEAVGRGGMRLGWRMRWTVAWALLISVSNWVTCLLNVALIDGLVCGVNERIWFLNSFISFRALSTVAAAVLDSIGMDCMYDMVRWVGGRNGGCSRALSLQDEHKTSAFHALKDDEFLKTDTKKREIEI